MTTEGDNQARRATEARELESHYDPDLIGDVFKYLDAPSKDSRRGD